MALQFTDTDDIMPSTPERLPIPVITTHLRSDSSISNNHISHNSTRPSSAEQANPTVTDHADSASSEFDESIDFIRRGEVSHGSSVHHEGSSQILGNLDVNNMFTTTDKDNKDDLKETNRKHFESVQSPFHIDNLSPEKHTLSDNGIIDHNQSLREQDRSMKNIDDEPSLKKQKINPINNIPSLKQPLAVNSSNEDDSMPDMIEMLGDSISPVKMSFENSNENDIPASPKGNNETNITIELQKLTPVHNNKYCLIDNSIKNKKFENFDDEHTFLQKLIKRNNELTERLHILDIQHNQLINQYENISYSNKKLKNESDVIEQKFEAKIKNMEDEKIILQQEKQKLLDRFDNIKRKNSEFKDEIKMMSQNQSILQEKYDQQISEINNLKQLNDELDSNYRTLKEDMESTDREKEEQSKTIISLQEDISLKNTQVEQFKADQQTSDDEKQKLLNDLKSLQNELKELIEEHNLLLSKNEGTNEEFKSQIDQLVLAKEHAERLLNEEKITNEEQISSLKQQVVELDDKVEAQKNIINQLETDNKQQVADITEKTNQLESLKNSLENTTDTAEISKAEVVQLNSEIKQLKLNETNLKDRIETIHKNVQDWKTKYESEKELYDKVSLELEKMTTKQSTIEDDHLADLEKVHEAMNSIQNDLAASDKTVSKLTEENKALQNELISLKNQKDSTEQNINIEQAKEPSAEETNMQITDLQKQLEEARDQLIKNREEADNSIRLMADDLYNQYAAKHTQKVALLKKGFEKKFQTKFDKLSVDNEGLKDELEKLKAELQKEKTEKEKILNMLENQPGHPAGV